MSKKHFEALAARIAKIVNPDARREAANAVADVASAMSPKFDRVRFMAAAGVAGKIVSAKRVYA